MRFWGNRYTLHVSLESGGWSRLALSPLELGDEIEEPDTKPYLETLLARYLAIPLG